MYLLFKDKKILPSQVDRMKKGKKIILKACLIQEYEEKSKEIEEMNKAIK